jgi:hypothetical protein
MEYVKMNHFFLASDPFMHCIFFTMKNHLYIFLLFLLLGCQEASNEKSHHELNTFNHFLREEQAHVLDKATVSFDNFLETNFSSEETQQKRAEAFLELIANDTWPEDGWALQTEKNSEILSEFERSGLRKEFRLFKYEEDLNSEEEIAITQRTRDEYDSVNDSLAFFNHQGKFLQGLAEDGTHDILISNYVEARKVGNISHTLLAKGHLKHLNYTNPLHKRIIVIDFYYDIMLWDLNRKKSVGDIGMR